MSQWRPILSTLRRHKTAAALIVLEIALTCAIVCNAVFLIAARIERVQVPSGVVENELVYLTERSIGREPDADAITRADLASLRALPGVRAATIVDQVPFGNRTSATGVAMSPQQVTPTLDLVNYYGDAALAETMGLRLVAGRFFTADEVSVEPAPTSTDPPRVPVMLLTRSAAQRLFPDRDAVGQSLYVFGPEPVRIVGVVERLISPSPARGNTFDDQNAMVLPMRPSFNHGTYLLRVEPARRAAVLAAAKAALVRNDARRVEIEAGTLADLREDYFRGDVAMAGLLAAVAVAMLVVTAFGIVGLASFWVQQRTRMIGTRRALGATRAQIRGYFQAENLLLTTAGIVLGMGGAYAMNQWLMTHYELPRLPAIYLPVGAVLLWALGQAAVLGPARRASAVPPAWAMRGLAG